MTLDSLIHAIVAAMKTRRAEPIAKPLDRIWPELTAYNETPASPPAQDSALREVAPNYSGWRSIDTAPEDEHVILATSGGHAGEALMLIDEDTGQQKWTWAHGPVHQKHEPWGWMPIQDPPTAPVLSDLRPDGLDGPTGAE